jgi:signal transduction histidine kinase
LAQDREGRIWVGPNAGLYWLDGEVFRYFSVPQVPHLQGIYALYCDAAGSLWIGTDLDGLLRLRAGRIDQWLWSRDGLPSNHITGILEDDEAMLWMSSENGIFGCSKQALDRYQARLTPRLQPTRLTVAEGLAHKVCTGVGQPSASQSADGRLWFPNGSALAVFAPRSIPDSMRVWPPVIDHVTVDGLPLAIDPRGLQVKSGARRIEFQYTSPNMIAPERLRFRVRLKGLDKDWVDAGSRREASFSQLPPGDYEFKVMASGPDDIWLEGAHPLTLEILPRIWERRSFQFTTGVCLMAVVAGAAWAIERNRSRRRLERLELQRTLDAERQRIARDIHDELGSGLTEIILLSDSLGETIQPIPADQNMVGEISSRARALTRSMDEVVWAINPRNDTLEGLVSYLGKFTQDYLAKAGVRCRWNVPLEIPDLLLTAEMRHNLYLACKEALHNIVKHAQATEASVQLDLTDAGFSVIIKDNGRGFTPSASPARGNGLTNMRQRLEKLHGECRVESTPGIGTCICFSLPSVMSKTLPT